MPIIRLNPFAPLMNPFQVDEDWTDLTLTQGINVYEEGDAVVVEAPMPGVSEDRIDIEYEDGMLRVSGRAEIDEEKKQKRTYHRLQKIASFSYATALPKAIDPSTMEAEVESGVVTIRAKVAESVKPRKITVKKK